jgi:VanZ family protein
MKWLRAWGPVVLWAVVISIFSTHYFTNEITGRFFIPLLRRFLPHAPFHTLLRIHHMIRKGAHVTEYFIFSLLVLRGFRYGRAGWRWSWAAWTLTLCATLAALDEFHQWFVPGRGATPVDSLIDVAGAAAALVVAWLFATRRASKHIHDTCL